MSESLLQLADTRLPPVRGRIMENAPMAGLTWFRTGGKAEALFFPADLRDLEEFLRRLDPVIDTTVVGLGSNLLVRDGGIPGVTIVPGRTFSEISCDGTRVTAGAGAVDLAVSRKCLAHRISGLEFLSGIPGTIGGALRMNAGAYGREMADVVVGARALDRQGRLHHLSLLDLGMSYRHCSVPDDLIFVSASLQGREKSSAEISSTMEDIASRRRSAQPVQARTGGSTFKNPEGCRAWELIESADCRHLSVGGASVSSQHCNFLVSDGSATASDIETLGERIREKVQARHGVSLEWEIRRVGCHAGGRPS